MGRQSLLNSETGISINLGLIHVYTTDSYEYGTEMNHDVREATSRDGRVFEAFFEIFNLLYHLSHLLDQSPLL
jgi:hypothetical protein